jgi:hypothetical protein
VFFISTVALIPGQAASALAAELLAISSIFWIAQVTGQVRYAKMKIGHPRLWMLPRVILAQAATAPFLIAGIALPAGATHALYWLVPGFVFSFVAGVMSAWVLLVEILR